MALRQYTPAQYLAALIAHGGSRVLTAKALGVNIRTLEKNLTVCRKRGMEVPSSPYTDGRRKDYLIEQVEAAHQAAPEHYHVKGVSTLYKDGEARLQWVKTDQDREQRMAQLRAACEAMKADIRPLKPLPRPRHEKYPDLANVYVFTDYHMGMLAWHREGGADWDLTIAEKTLLGCFQQMIVRSPPSSVGILAQLGDFLHTDGLLPMTPTSHHVLDADSRFQKIVAVTIRVLRTIIDRMLEKHDTVKVLMAEGNHDIVSSIWLQQMFSALYEREKRIEVIDSPLPYYAIQHGETMIGFHHGHLSKNDKLPGVMAAQFPKMWGATKYRYCHTGHRHHIEEKEHPGIVIVQHPTLAARDAHAARGAWFAERGARCETYHLKHGHEGRIIVNPDMLE